MGNCLTGPKWYPLRQIHQFEHDLAAMAFVEKWLKKRSELCLNVFRFTLAGELLCSPESLTFDRIHDGLSDW